MIAAAIRWLLSTKVGRFVSAVVGATVFVLLLLARAFYAGRKAEAADNDKRSAENLRERAKVDDEVASLPADDRRRRLAEWLRNHQQ